jgi:hypothetical protein
MVSIFIYQKIGKLQNVLITEAIKSDWSNDPSSVIGPQDEWIATTTLPPG